MLIQAVGNSQAQQTALDAFSKWAPYLIPAGGLLISFFGLIINWFNRRDTRRAEKQRKKIEEQMHDQTIRIAIADLEKRMNEHLNQRARRNFRFQLATAFVLFLLISGVGGYLWVITERIQSAIQPDQLNSAVSEAIKKTPSVSVPPEHKKGPNKSSASAPISSHRANPKATDRQPGAPGSKTGSEQEQ
jgi:hypothetical protein